MIKCNKMGSVYNPELPAYKGSFTELEWKYLQGKYDYLYLREEGAIDGFFYGSISGAITGAVGGLVAGPPPALGSAPKEVLKYMAKQSIADGVGEGLAGGTVGYMKGGTEGAVSGGVSGLVSGTVTGLISGGISYKAQGLPQKIINKFKEGKVNADININTRGRLMLLMD